MSNLIKLNNQIIFNQCEERRHVNNRDNQSVSRLINPTSYLYNSSYPDVPTFII